MGHAAAALDHQEISFLGSPRSLSLDWPKIA